MNNLPLESRLENFPQKIAVPFRQLLAAGQITEDIIHIVLDAGNVAGCDSQKLIGFAVGFLHLRSQGVPVHDVIRMAKSQKRRINLTWSAKRWKEEHDKLSRAEALLRMAHENTRYDVSKYETLLPDRFNGYIIRTSRRLGMEGLRQRHCVASFDSRIRNGSCAIVVVFVKKQRWTVEIWETGDPECPLRIAQIKTRYNGLPPVYVSERICKELGIDPEKPTHIAPYRLERNHLHMENLRRVLPILRENNIADVTVSFDGENDEGAISDIWYNPQSLAEAVSSLQVEYLSQSQYLEDGRWMTAVTPKQGSLKEAIEELAYDYIEETGVDWYNDDGGFGSLVIDVQQGTATLEVNVRSTHTTTEFHGQYDIVTGEEIFA